MHESPRGQQPASAVAVSPPQSRKVRYTVLYRPPAGRLCLIMYRYTTGPAGAAPGASILECHCFIGCAAHGLACQQTLPQAARTNQFIMG